MRFKGDKTGLGDRNYGMRYCKQNKVKINRVASVGLTHNTGERKENHKNS